MLDYDSNTWTKLPPMNQDRADHSCVRWKIGGNDGILAVGGYYVHPLKSVEFFDFARNNWYTPVDGKLIIIFEDANKKCTIVLKMFSNK